MVGDFDEKVGIFFLLLRGVFFLSMGYKNFRGGFISAVLKNVVMVLRHSTSASRRAKLILDNKILASCQILCFDHKIFCKNKRTVVCSIIGVLWSCELLI